MRRCRWVIGFLFCSMFGVACAGLSAPKPALPVIEVLWLYKNMTVLEAAAAVADALSRWLERTFPGEFEAVPAAHVRLVTCVPGGRASRCASLRRALPALSRALLVAFEGSRLLRFQSARAPRIAHVAFCCCSPPLRRRSSHLHQHKNHYGVSGNLLETLLLQAQPPRTLRGIPEQHRHHVPVFPTALYFEVLNVPVEHLVRPRARRAHVAPSGLSCAVLRPRASSRCDPARGVCCARRGCVPQKAHQAKQLYFTWHGVPPCVLKSYSSVPGVGDSASAGELQGGCTVLPDHHARTACWQKQARPLYAQLSCSACPPLSLCLLFVSSVGRRRRWR